MITETLYKLETRLAASENISQENREALEALVKELRAEIASLADDESAESIAGFSETSTREVLRQNPDSSLIDLSMAGLRRSVEAFEVSHPRLTDIVNRFCNQLSDLGI